jgi:hypothetical protein
MTNAKEKLLEAKFFLERMIEKESERDAFKFNLSAFLSAARSVTLIMQTEFDKVPGFKEWYADKQTKMQDDTEMKLLNNKRVMTIHQKPVRPSAQINATLTEQIVFSDSASIVVTHANGTVEQQESEPEPKRVPAKSEATVEWRWYFEELPEKDVVTICNKHIGKLAVLVEECESKFS